MVGWVGCVTLLPPDMSLLIFAKEKQAASSGRAMPTLLPRFSRNFSVPEVMSRPPKEPKAQKKKKEKKTICAKTNEKKTAKTGDGDRASFSSASCPRLESRHIRYPPQPFLSICSHDFTACRVPVGRKKVRGVVRLPRRRRQPTPLPPLVAPESARAARSERVTRRCRQSSACSGPTHHRRDGHHHHPSRAGATTGPHSLIILVAAIITIAKNLPARMSRG